jgi:hypothetical protein
VTIVNNDVPEQMKRSRFVNGRFERLEGDVWVPWPVLTIDKLGSDEAKRMTTQHAPRVRHE